MKAIELLGKIGLEKHEAQIYTALLELGPSLISAISRHTGLHRPTIYQTIRSLEEKGLISASPRGKRKRYTAEAPEKLQSLIEGLRKNLNTVVPELQNLYVLNKNRPLVKFLERRAGITSVFEDIVTTLKRGDIYYLYTTRKKEIKAEKYFPPNFRERRDAKAIQRFIIASELSKIKFSKPNLNRIVKIIPKEYTLFDQNITKVIYADRIAFLDHNTETATVIQNQAIAESEKTIFKALFDLL